MYPDFVTKFLFQNQSNMGIFRRSADFGSDLNPIFAKIWEIWAKFGNFLGNLPVFCGFGKIVFPRLEPILNIVKDASGNRSCQGVLKGEEKLTEPTVANNNDKGETKEEGVTAIRVGNFFSKIPKKFQKFRNFRFFKVIIFLNYFTCICKHLYM